MSEQLNPPSFYQPMLDKRIKERHAGWPAIGPLRIERKTNRHTTAHGYSWGWYEVCPLGITAGYWSDESGRDDIAPDLVKSWNESAAIIATQDSEGEG